MDKIATVYYDGEVFRPEVPIDLEPNTRYVISIEAVLAPSISEEVPTKVETVRDGPDPWNGTLPRENGRADEGTAKIGSLSTWLMRMAGTVDGPPDWSAEHDHYIHGTPKRGNGSAS